MDELIRQAEEAAAAAQAARDADGVVGQMTDARTLAIANAEKSVNDAEDALQKSIEDRHAAQVVAIEQLTEAQTALLEFVKGQQATIAAA